MMKKRKKPFVVTHGSYPFDVMVCIGTTHAEVIKALNKKMGRKMDKEEADYLELHSIGRTVMLDGGQTILMAEDLKNNPDFHANLSHEILHAVSFLFDRVGLPHTTQGDEAWAYQVGHLTREIYKHLYA
ncbi:hypothetical protein C4568_03725 [Candidatus Parcubacteria bacterium]|nr:MAG: hypothetical protein C4568_03725 [Candidatus Parcubacteria bacterium]